MGTSHTPPYRPNILWISIEDVSPRFGCYGDQLARTPHINALAQGGTVYDLAFATAGVCSPSRASIITGQYAMAFGAHHHRTSTTDDLFPGLPTPYEAVPPPYVKAFPEYLRTAGYYCTNNEKTDYQFTPPRSVWDECGPTAHWRSRGAGQPFFAVFNPMDTHESQMWERSHRPLRTNPDLVRVPPYLPDTPAIRATLARHYDNIEDADTRVGELLHQLNEDGLADDTVVFLWSDHGEGLPRGKITLYDSGTRVPLIVRWPTVVQPGTRCPDLVSLIDLAPTVLSIADIEIPSHLHGQPFLGPHRRRRDVVFAGRDRCGVGYDMSRSARDTRYKYIRNFHADQPILNYRPYGASHPAFQEIWRLHAAGDLTPLQSALVSVPRPIEELYDCIDDPHEVRNLTSDPDHADVLHALRDAVTRWRTDIGDLGDLRESELAERMWPGGEQPTTASPAAVAHELDGSMSVIVDSHDTTAETVTLYCPTQGASISYCLNGKWHAYGGGPIDVPPNGLTLTAQAHRIGWRESPEVHVAVKPAQQMEWTRS